MNPVALVIRCGTVVAADERGCRVEMDRERCAGCAGRCSAGLSLLGEITLDVAAGDARRHVVGERVSVGVPRRGMALAALVVFGLPLAAMAGAGAMAEGLAGAGLPAAVGGFLSGVAVAVALGRSGRLAAWVRPRLGGFHGTDPLAADSARDS